MKLAWLSAAVLVTGCIKVVGGDDGGDDTPCTGDDCGSGSGSGSGGGSGGGSGAGCQLVEDEGPGGHLAAFEIGATSEWILTREEDGRSTLWERSANTWHTKSLGASCLDGFLATSTSGATAVACLVKNGATKDLKLFEIGAQITPTLVVEGSASNTDSSIGEPLAFAYDSSDRPSVLWRYAVENAGGRFDLYGGALSRKTSTGLMHTGYERVFADVARLVAFGGELLVVEQKPAQGIRILHSASMSAMAELDVNANAFDLAADANGVHVAVADADTGNVRYFRRGDGSQVAATIGAGGGGVSISLDAQGEPVVGYQVLEALQIAKKSGATWSSDELDNGGVGSRSVVRFAADGTLRVAYQDDALDQVVVLREVCP